MTDYDWVLLGYQAREKTPKPDWLEVDNVKEIASVSTCMAASSPVPWTPQIQNAMHFWATPEDAKGSIPQPEGWTIDGYRILLTEFAEGIEQPHTIESYIEVGYSVNDEAISDLRRPIPPQFRKLGFDAVNRTIGFSFLHSPLSCNHMASEIPVNRFCLIDRLEDAIAAARRFSIEQPEPGSYYVVEVWRESVET